MIRLKYLRLESRTTEKQTNKGKFIENICQQLPTMQVVTSIRSDIIDRKSQTELKVMRKKLQVATLPFAIWGDIIV